jgi:excisionase family DNA binding protein
MYAASAVPHGMTRSGEESPLPGLHPEEKSSWIYGCAGRFGGVSRMTGAAQRLRGTIMPGVDEVRSSRDRDKLTIAEVCADLGISRRTFYEWRAKGRAPRCITLPNGSLRIRRSEYQRWLASREEAA